MDKRRSEIVDKISLLEERIKNAFADYCNIPYNLHAIMIHDGLADSGHYYSFIYDRKQSVWWRFNDHTVSMEAEETVMLEAFGGQRNSYKSAYALIYINQFITNQIEALPQPLY